MKKRLYFYWGKPTEAQREEARRLGALLRDARACRVMGKTCDEAYGDVPEPYLAFQHEVPKELRVVEGPSAPKGPDKGESEKSDKKPEKADGKAGKKADKKAD